MTGLSVHSHIPARRREDAIRAAFITRAPLAPISGKAVVDAVMLASMRMVFSSVGCILLATAHNRAKTAVTAAVVCASSLTHPSSYDCSQPLLRLPLPLLEAAAEDCPDRKQQLLPPR
jgi:hypothetical protein